VRLAPGMLSRKSGRPRASVLETCAGVGSPGFDANLIVRVWTGAGITKRRQKFFGSGTASRFTKSTGTRCLAGPDNCHCAKQLFCKALSSPAHPQPRVINTDLAPIYG